MDEQQERMQMVRDATDAYAKMLKAVLPDGPERAHVMGLLKTIIMRADIALTRVTLESNHAVGQIGKQGERGEKHQRAEVIGPTAQAGGGDSAEHPAQGQRLQQRWVRDVPL